MFGTLYRDWVLKQRLARLQRLHNTTLASSAMAQAGSSLVIEERYTQVNEKLSNFEIYLDMRIASGSFTRGRQDALKSWNMKLDAEALYYDNIATAS